MRSGADRTRTPIKMQTTQQSTFASTSSPQRNKSALASRGQGVKERSDNKENGLTSSPRGTGFTMKVSPFNQTLSPGGSKQTGGSPRRQSNNTSGSPRKSMFGLRERQLSRSGKQFKNDVEEPTEQETEFDIAIQSIQNKLKQASKFIETSKK